MIPRPDAEGLGVYIHIPFCKQKCSYCDFHFSTQTDYVDRMMSAMLRELGLRSGEWQGQEIRSIYFGGGTPSLVQAHHIRVFIERIQEEASFDPGIEITLEANPDDITEEQVKHWKEMGVNRLSIGIQSFHDPVLRSMNRAHDSGMSKDAIVIARAGGIQDFTLDLIYGAPKLKGYRLEEDIDQMLSLEPTHLSAYSLTIEPGTAYAHQVKKGELPLPDDEELERQFHTVVERFAAAGYQRYEVSNFARDGRISVHNTGYWMNRPYLGIGPSAHSYHQGQRSWNVANNHQYMRGIDEGKLPSEKETLSREMAYNEYVMTRLRTIWGIDLEQVKDKFQLDVLSHFEGTLNRNSDFFEEDQGRLVLNQAGMLRADGLAAELFL